MAQTREERLARRRESYQRNKSYYKEYWNRNRERGLQHRKKYKDRHPEKQREWGKKYRERVKLETFSKLGGSVIKCAGCGESRMACLTVDHIKGGGRQHLRELGLQAGNSLYLWLLKKDDVSDFQVLCMNCQWIKRVVNNEAKQGNITNHPKKEDISKEESNGSK